MSVINAGADLALGALDKDIADRYKVSHEVDATVL